MNKHAHTSIDAFALILKGRTSCAKSVGSSKKTEIFVKKVNEKLGS